ncbi:MAG: hypothetical protein EOO73_18080 [Myxococcales bacterium]|nr:MAG: hypothetical protein EOO73_18080 [Myxococcales bacterium]
MRFWSVTAAVSALCVVYPAYAGTSRLVRTSLDAAQAEAAPANSARLIRSSLDDPSHRELPLESPVRLIRVSLDETNAFAPLEPAARPERQLRTSLD